MHFRYFKDYGSMSAAAARIFKEAVTGTDFPVACLATGGSPLGMYRLLRTSGSDYRELTVIKLDEWLGLPMDHPATCEAYLRKEVLEPLGIPGNRYIGFHSDAEDPNAEVARMNSELARLNNINICVLGLGRNGHIGLNEPADFLSPHCHRTLLAEESRGHAMLASGRVTVTEGITLGIADILKADRILLLVAGAEKKEVFEHLCQPRITSQLPASLLWVHRDVEVLVDCGNTGILQRVE